ncbi:hypothetical protein MKQ70_12120 [Chitinophaga sedimenti]|uniref:hypothetical protein n=1 Tax=Chitinophaga sedimenti TaxID=2033606 RepID=UPI002006602D|nr:hypothetical protein [Chitinophaga sedimenti]MCK7555721.1 hypothetical protein [Chitinophaga sedimenti]
MDKHLHAPQTWYRLHATDADGKVIQSANIQLKNPLTKFNYKVYQDAASHHYRFVYEGDAAAGARGKIVVYNAAGAQILRRDLGRISRSQQYEFDLSGQPAGIYYLGIDIDGMVYTAELLAN